MQSKRLMHRNLVKGSTSEEKMSGLMQQGWQESSFDLPIPVSSGFNKKTINHDFAGGGMLASLKFTVIGKVQGRSILLKRCIF